MRENANEASRKENLFGKGFPSGTILSKTGIALALIELLVAVSLVAVTALIRPFDSIARVAFVCSCVLAVIALVRVRASIRLGRALSLVRSCVADIESGNFAARVRSPGVTDVDALIICVNRL